MTFDVDIISVPISEKLLKQSGSWRFSLSKFRLIQVRTVCFVRDAKSTSPCPRMVNSLQTSSIGAGLKVAQFLVSNDPKLSVWVEDHANAGSIRVNIAKLRPITRKVILSWLLPLPGLLRTPRPLDVSGVGGDGFWTQRTGLASPGRQVSLKWESSSSLDFPLHGWTRSMFLLPLPQAMDSDLHLQYVKSQVSLHYIYSSQSGCKAPIWPTTNPSKVFLLPDAKLPFSKSGTQVEGIGQASRLQNLRSFLWTAKTKVSFWKIKEQSVKFIHWLKLKRFFKQPPPKKNEREFGGKATSDPWHQILFKPRFLRCSKKKKSTSMRHILLKRLRKK